MFAENNNTWLMEFSRIFICTKYDLNDLKWNISFDVKQYLIFFSQLRGLSIIKSKKLERLIFKKKINVCFSLYFFYIHV